MKESFGDPNAISYLNKNIQSVNQFVSLIVYSLMLRYSETEEFSTYGYLKIKISDSVFDYYDQTSIFKMKCTLSYFDKEKNRYIPECKVRTKEGEHLEILRICQYDNNLNSFAIGSSYDSKRLFIDFGLQISAYNVESSTYEDWQDLNTMNVQTKDYVTSLSSFYFPRSLCPDANFLETEMQTWLLDNNIFSYVSTESPYWVPNDDIKYYYKMLKGEEAVEYLYIYPIIIYVNGVITLMSADANIVAEIEEEGGPYCYVQAKPSMLGIKPLPALVDYCSTKSEGVTLKITITLSVGQQIVNKFKLQSWNVAPPCWEG